MDRTGRPVDHRSHFEVNQIHPLKATVFRFLAANRSLLRESFSIRILMSLFSSLVTF